MNTKLVTAGAAARRPHRLARHDHEAGRVVLGILDVLRQRYEAVDLAGQLGGDRGDRGVAQLLDLGGAAGGVGAHDRLEPVRAQEVAALRQGVDMAAHGADAVETRAGQGQQMVVHPLEMLADDIQARIGHQMVDVGDPSGDRVLDRDHREPRRPVAHRSERILESRRRAGSSCPGKPGGRPGRNRLPASPGRRSSGPDFRVQPRVRSTFALKNRSFVGLWHMDLIREASRDCGDF